MKELIDYDFLNLRQIATTKHAFEAWTGNDENQETHIIDVVDFLEYCRETSLINCDAFISGHGAGLVSVPQSEELRWDAGRQEFYEAAQRPREYTFAEFMADFSGNGLTDALQRFINDYVTTQKQVA